ncbi:DDE-type integrase/transposase/recombinase [Photobacterium damselae]|uniref:DDE-type integrase/transposase/recombinase n=1 Tax=Photobacterium damselae TaxID=38293 RepID=UPI0039C1E7E9
MDEIYIKIKGKWWYYYRAVEKYGDVIDFYLVKHKMKKPLRPFYERPSECMDYQIKSLLIKVVPMLKYFII